MTQLYTLLDVVGDITELANRMSTQKALAQKIGISPQYLADILDGRRAPGKKVLTFLGYEKVICYRYIKGSTK